MTSVYLDYAAGAPLRPAAARVLADVLASGAGNPSSVHWAGARARALLEAAREEVAAAIGARAPEVLFTSGATEANNLALAGVAAAAERRLRIAVPASEHASVLRTAQALARAGHDVTVLPVDAHGRTNSDAVVAAAPDLLSVALVNAETGVVQDCAALAAAARRSGARVHVDAAQAAAVMPLDVAALDCDLLTLSAHKVGGPKGIGAVVLADGVLGLEPLLRGGGQEFGHRAGTEDVAGIAGFGAAVKAAMAALEGETIRLEGLRNRLEKGLREAADAIVFSRDVPRLPNTALFTVPGLKAETAVIGFDLAGVAVSSGSACSSGKVQPSHVLQAMGFGPEIAQGAVRLSLGWSTTEADIDSCLEAWRKLASTLLKGSDETQLERF